MTHSQARATRLLAILFLPLLPKTSVVAWLAPQAARRTTVTRLPSVSPSPRRGTSLLRLSSSEDSSAGVPTTFVKCGRCQSVYPLDEAAFGSSTSRRLECAVCGHSWFQGRDRLLQTKSDFAFEPLPPHELERIQYNLEKNKNPQDLGELKIYVGNLSFDCQEDDLLELFQECGPVGHVSLIRDERGRSKGFAFVSMRFKEDGEKALEKLDGMEYKGRPMAVRESTN